MAIRSVSLHQTVMLRCGLAGIAVDSTDVTPPSAGWAVRRSWMLAFGTCVLVLPGALRALWAPFCKWLGGLTSATVSLPSRSVADGHVGGGGAVRVAGHQQAGVAGGEGEPRRPGHERGPARCGAVQQRRLVSEVDFEGVGRAQGEIELHDGTRARVHDAGLVDAAGEGDDRCRVA